MHKLWIILWPLSLERSILELIIMNDDHTILGFLEAAVQMCSVKVFLKISQNSWENNCARVPFLIKLQAWGVHESFHKECVCHQLRQQFQEFCSYFLFKHINSNWCWSFSLGKFNVITRNLWYFLEREKIHLKCLTGFWMYLYTDICIQK